MFLKKSHPFVFYCLFLVISIFHTSPLAMDSKEGEGVPRHVGTTLLSITKEACLGVGLVWTGSQFEGTYLEPTSSILGMKLISNALYNLMSYAYLSWRSSSINSQMIRLEDDFKKARGNTKKAPVIIKKIKELEEQDPQKEIIRSLNYLSYGLEITAALFWIPQILNHMGSTYKIGYYGAYTFYPDFSLGFELDPRINIFTTGASLIGVVWSLKDLMTQLKGKTPAASSPIHSFVKACSTKTSATIFEELLRKRLIAAIHQGDFSKLGDYNMPILLLKYLYYLRIGDSVENFFKGCQRAYEERKYWFDLVNELAASPPQSIESPMASVPQVLITPKEQVQHVTPPSKHESSKIAVVEETQINVNQNNEEMPQPQSGVAIKSPKIKTRGVPGKVREERSTNIFKKSSSSKSPSVHYQFQNDEARQSLLSDIQKTRFTNSAKTTIVENMYKAAAKFVNGSIETTGNKITIRWLRGSRNRSVKFEFGHKQINEKASVLKGHKLKMALDALEQIYLDGWDKEKIITHLNGRFKLYNLPYQLLEILWTDQKEED